MKKILVSRVIVSLCISGLIAFAVACSGSSSPEDAIIVDDVIGDVGGDTAGGDVIDDIAVDTTVPIDWETYLHPADAVTPDGKKRLVILHTNDLHAHMNGTGPVMDFTPGSINDDDTVGGLARIAAMFAREKANLGANEVMIGLDAGDFSFGTAFSALAKDTGLELKMMDQMGYVGVTIGNHELDWTPAGLAEVITNGLEGSDGLTVLASNLVYSAESADDDALAALVGTKIKPYKVITLDNGIKVGLFGLLGTNAIKLSPHADPVTVRPLDEAATEMVDILRNQEGVDIVIALSHSGVTEGATTGEDETLAGAVTGIDVIISGHTHTLLAEPTIVDGTYIVQTGCYGKALGRLVMVEKDGGGYQFESWKTMPVDDTNPGLPEYMDEIDGYQAMLGETVFQGLGAGYADAVATTEFNLMPVEYSESGLGNLIADGVRASAAKFVGEPFDVAFEANGVIRDGFAIGQTGKITMGDIFQVLPLGIGPDGDVGYPLLSIYLTAAELKAALEIIVGIAPIVSDSFFLQISGLKFEYKPGNDTFYMVTKVYMADGNGGYETTPLDTTSANTKLYRVATNLYIGQMLGVIKEMLGGMVSLEPKNAEGVIYDNIEDAIIDIDPDTAGIQELKLWRAMYDFMANLPEPTEGALAAVPAVYATDMKRQKAVQ
jgi:5'-nucleotidase